MRRYVTLQGRGPGPHALLSSLWQLQRCEERALQMTSVTGTEMKVTTDRRHCAWNMNTCQAAGRWCKINAVIVSRQDEPIQSCHWNYSHCHISSCGKAAVQSAQTEGLPCDRASSKPGGAA